MRAAPHAQDTQQDTGHPCARGDWCSARRITRDPAGTATVTPARTYQAFCPGCTDQIITCLRDLPPAYAALAAELGHMPRTGQSAHVPFGPRTPLREDADALMRLMAAVLRGWEARTRSAAGRIPPQPLPVGSPASVRAAADALTVSIATFLSLPAGWMTRTYPLPATKPGHRGAGAPVICRHCGAVIARSPYSGLWWAACGQPGSCTGGGHRPRNGVLPATAPVPPDFEAGFGDAEIIRVGVDSITVMATLTGQDAGLEILTLHRRAQAILGQLPGRPDLLDGVPCRREDCGDYALERAPAPASPSQPAMHSRCATCRDEMDQDAYALWVTQWATWAGQAGPLVCRRCQRERHGECAWRPCSCRAGGHAVAA